MSRRRLGQHFLASDHKARRVIDIGRIEPTDIIVEIGPGKGALTDKILRKGCRVVAIEMDRGLAERLIKRHGENPRLQVFIEDAAKFDYGILPPPFKVISNLPFCASVAIFARLLEFKKRIPLMVLTFQLEVARRLVAIPETKSYGPLSVFAQYHAEVTEKFIITREDFRPPPRVDSAVVKVAPYPYPPFKAEDEEFFFALVRKSFGQRRKKLINNLKGMDIEVETVERALLDVGIDPDRRAETVPLADFVKLSNRLGNEIAVSCGSLKK